jgi:hypothetical protein
MKGIIVGETFVWKVVHGSRKEAGVLHSDLWSSERH